MKFSVIFAAYREVGEIPKNILLLKREDAEFIIAGDCLDENEIKKVRRLSDRVKLCLSDSRRGKVRSINEAAELAEGEYLVFVDADTEILDKRVLREIEKSGGDFGGTVLLVGGRSFFERMVRIDALFMSAILMLQSRFGVSTGLHGAFFFMKREVFEELGRLSREIVEDVDLGIRATDRGFKPVFLNVKAARISAPEDFKSWLRQRIRWAIGGAVMAFRHFKFFLRNLIPTLVQLFVLFPLIFLLLPFLFLWSGPIPAPIVFYLFGGVFFVAWTELLKKILSYTGISIVDEILYYLIYGPIWGALATLCLIYTILKLGRVKKVPGWKV